MDMKREVVVVPVSDVDRAKSFYEALGGRLDANSPARATFGWSGAPRLGVTDHLGV